MMSRTWRTEARWLTEPDLSAWIAQSRLNLLRALPDPINRLVDTGEDNGDSHLKALRIHHEVIVPITAGKLDLGTWQRVFYAEFDGQRDKRVIVKVMGE